MYRLAKDPDGPFPISYIGGKTRDGIVLHDCGRGDRIAGVDGRRQGLAGGIGGVRLAAGTAYPLNVFG